MEKTHKCEMIPMFRYTWPGRDEEFTCPVHGQQILTIANALGFHLQLIPLEIEEMVNHTCAQNVKEE